MGNQRASTFLCFRASMVMRRSSSSTNLQTLRAPPKKQANLSELGGGSKMRFLLIRLWIEDLIWVKNIPQTPKVPQSNLIHADWTVHNRRPQKRYPFLTVQQINQPTGWWPRTHLLSDYPSGKHDIDIDWKYLLVVSTCEEKNESNRDFFPTRC